MEESGDDPQWQTWQPPRGPKTRWAARLILLMMAIGFAVMAAMAFFGG